jgi:hypothetical protein
MRPGSTASPSAARGRARDAWHAVRSGRRWRGAIRTRGTPRAPGPADHGPRGSRADGRRSPGGPGAGRGSRASGLWYPARPGCLHTVREKVGLATLTKRAWRDPVPSTVFATVFVAAMPIPLRRIPKFGAAVPAAPNGTGKRRRETREPEEPRGDEEPIARDEAEECDDDEDEDEQDEDDEGDVDDDSADDDDDDDSDSDKDEDEDEEVSGEEDEEELHDDGDGEEDFGDEMLNDMPEAVLNLIARLKEKVISLRQKLNGSKHRSDHNMLRKECGPLTQQQMWKSESRRVQRQSKFFVDELQRRKLCKAEIVNKLGLSLTVEEREKMRELGFLRQEWFLAKRDCVHQLQTCLYTAENTLEIRLSELVSIRSLRRMRRVLTTVRDAAGKWVHYVVASPPTPGRKGGDPSLKQSHNKAQKIYSHRPLHAPHVIATDDAVRAASRKLLSGRNMEVAVPSKDGLSGAAWNVLDVARDVYAGLKTGVDNLRPLLSNTTQPEAAGPSKRARKRSQQACSSTSEHIGRLRRLWLGFDGLTWTKRNGLVRWCLRSCDSIGKHNDKRFAREGLTYVGSDKNEGLVLSSKIGGESSIRALTDAAVICTRTDGSQLPDALRADDSPQRVGRCLMHSASSARSSSTSGLRARSRSRSS